ncbi:DNA polymerase III subunit chi [Pseudomaricurvus alkylphenolicus]|jgi:DNA polymerase-3 subunit chi|uniref:DNA polymerase III subunit chi n=1 Tax=Pseudomaricurvus alkylphenolicus TaxID=1306991 RepID=UPI0014208970|nr:DNA polymerase III subunit chi [Pseudomaricurvus alkylphenolicus]NIB41542.1 DNA polymerase III subunit chi [Pseudomaricurvus alkylphenolicus]
MTRVDFYVLKDSAASKRLDFVCRLTQKAHASGSKVYIAVDTREQAEALDQRLWSFKPESFVAHDCQGNELTGAPVHIGYSDEGADHHDLLINLCHEVPPFFSRFQRLAEVVCQEDKVLSTTREHYTFYRHRGYPIETHNL